MEIIQTILTVFIWFLCPILILLILVQGGAGDLSSTFGGGGQLDSTLGVGASRKMGKLTGWLSFAFLVIVLFMAIPPGGSFGAHAASGVDDPALAPDAGAILDEGAVDEVSPEAAAEPLILDPADAAAPTVEQPAAAETDADKQDAGLEIDVGAQPDAENE